MFVILFSLLNGVGTLLELLVCFRFYFYVLIIVVKFEFRDPSENLNGPQIHLEYVMVRV